MTPKRIRRKRAKGWRMPENVVYVGRPSKWGNPYTVIGLVGGGYAIYWHSEGEFYQAISKVYDQRQDAAFVAVMFYKALTVTRNDLSELRGKDLACWCPLDQPCHADVLLELANQEVHDAP